MRILAKYAIAVLLVLPAPIKAQFSLSFVQDTCTNNPMPAYGVQANSLNAKYYVTRPDTLNGLLQLKTFINGVWRTTTNIEAEGLISIEIPDVPIGYPSTLDAQLILYQSGGPLGGLMVGQITMSGLLMVWDPPLLTLDLPVIILETDSIVITNTATAESFGFSESFSYCTEYRSFVHYEARRMDGGEILYYNKRDQFTGVDGVHTWSFTLPLSESFEPVCVRSWMTREDTNEQNPDFPITEIDLQEGSENELCDILLTGTSTHVAGSPALATTKVAPNPFTESLNIASETVQLYEMYSLDGHVVASGMLEIGNNHLATSSWATGSYILRTGTGERVQIICLK